MSKLKPTVSSYPVYASNAVGAEAIKPINQIGNKQPTYELTPGRYIPRRDTKKVVDASVIELLPGSETLTLAEKTWFRRHWAGLRNIMRSPNYSTSFFEEERNNPYSNRRSSWSPLNRLFQSIWGDKDHKTTRGFVNDLTSHHDYSLIYSFSRNKLLYRSYLECLSMVSVDPQLLIHGLPENNFAEIFHKRSTAALKTLFPAYFKPKNIEKTLQQINEKAKWFSRGKITFAFKKICLNLNFIVANAADSLHLFRFGSEKRYFRQGLLEIAVSQAKVTKAIKRLEKKLLLQQFLCASEYDRANNDRLAFQQNNNIEETDPLFVGENIIPITFETGLPLSRFTFIDATNLHGILEANAKLREALGEFKTTLDRWKNKFDKTHFNKISLSTGGNSDPTFERIGALQEYLIQIRAYLKVSNNALIKTSGAYKISDVCNAKANRQGLVDPYDILNQLNQSMPQYDNVSNRRASQRDTVVFDKQSFLEEFMQRPLADDELQTRGTLKEPVPLHLSGKAGLFEKGKAVMLAADRLEEVTTIAPFSSTNSDQKSHEGTRSDLTKSLTMQLQKFEGIIPKTEITTVDEYENLHPQTKMLLEIYQKNIINTIINQARARANNPKFAPNSLMTKYKLRKIINIPSFIGMYVWRFFKDYEKDVLLSAATATILDWVVKDLKNGDQAPGYLNHAQLIELFDKPEIKKVLNKILDRFKKLVIYGHEYIQFDAEVTNEPETFASENERLGKFYDHFKGKIDDLEKDYNASHAQTAHPSKYHVVNDSISGKITLPGANDRHTRLQSHLPLLEKGMAKPVSTILGDLTCAHRTWRRRLFPFNSDDRKEFAHNLFQNLATKLIGEKPAADTSSVKRISTGVETEGISATSSAIDNDSPAIISTIAAPTSKKASQEEKWFKHNVRTHFGKELDQFSLDFFDIETSTASHVEFEGAVNLIHSKASVEGKEPRKYARPLTFMNGVNLKKFVITSKDNNQKSYRFGLALNRNNYSNIISFFTNQKNYGRALNLPYSDGRVAFINNQPYLTFTEIPRNLLGLAPELEVQNSSADQPDAHHSADTFDTKNASTISLDLKDELSKNPRLQKILENFHLTPEQQNDFFITAQQMSWQIRNSFLLYFSQTAIDVEGNPDLTLIPRFPKNLSEMGFFIFKQIEIFVDQYFPRSSPSNQFNSNYFGIVNAIYDSVMKQTGKYFEVVVESESIDKLLSKKIESCGNEWFLTQLNGHLTNVISVDRQDELSMHASNLVAPSALDVPPPLDSYMDIEKTADSFISSLYERTELYSEKSPAAQYAAVVLPAILSMLNIGLDSALEGSDVARERPAQPNHYDLRDDYLKRAKELHTAVLNISHQAKQASDISIQNLLERTRRALIKYLSIDTELTVRFKAELDIAIRDFEKINTATKYIRSINNGAPINPSSKYQATVVALAQSIYGTSNQAGTKEFLNEINRLADLAKAEVGKLKIRYTFERLIELTDEAMQRFLVPVATETILMSQEYQHLTAFHEVNETYHEWLSAPRKRYVQPGLLPFNIGSHQHISLQPHELSTTSKGIKEIKDSEQAVAKFQDSASRIKRIFDENKRRMLTVTPRTTAYIKALSLFDLTKDANIYISKQKDFFLLRENLTKAENLVMIFESVLDAAGTPEAPDWDNMDEEAYVHIISTAKHIINDTFANTDTLPPGNRPKNSLIQPIKTLPGHTTRQEILSKIDLLSSPENKSQRIALLNDLTKIFLKEENIFQTKVDELIKNKMGLPPGINNAFFKQEFYASSSRLHPPTWRLQKDDLDKIDPTLIAEWRLPSSKSEITSRSNDSKNTIDESTVENTAVDVTAFNFAPYLIKGVMDDNLRAVELEKLQANIRLPKEFRLEEDLNYFY